MFKELSELDDLSFDGVRSKLVMILSKSHPTLFSVYLKSLFSYALSFYYSILKYKWAEIDVHNISLFIFFLFCPTVFNWPFPPL